MSAAEPITRVAFIGLGHMGGHMCRNVITAGLAVSAYDLDAEAVARAAADGARPAASVADCVRDAQILLTSLPGPPQVEAVLCGTPSEPSAIAAMAAGAIVAEMSTSSLEVGRRARAQADAAGVHLLDAPVAGQTIGAEAATLAIYAGGEPEAFARALPVFEAMGDPQRIFLLGPGGCGYAVKLLLNLTWFIQTIATAEALTIGVRAGVDLSTLHTALVASPANSVFLEHDVLPLLERGDYDEGFTMKLVTKDLGLAIDLARDAGVPVELSALVEQIHRRARAVYGDDAGEMSAVRLYEDLAGVELRWRT
jgi:3-hydroxyisobutyrate dehydrogenase